MSKTFSVSMPISLLILCIIPFRQPQRGRIYRHYFRRIHINSVETLQLSCSSHFAIFLLSSVTALTIQAPKTKKALPYDNAYILQPLRLTPRHRPRTSLTIKKALCGQRQIIDHYAVGLCAAFFLSHLNHDFKLRFSRALTHYKR